MRCCCPIPLQVAEDRYALDVGCNDVALDLAQSVEMHVNDWPYYEGPYEADPRFIAQTFATERTQMLGDFRVNAINYTEAPNEYGTTVTIGG